MARNDGRNWTGWMVDLELARTGQRVFAVLGDPVGQVRSAALFSDYFKKNNVDAAVIPLQVKARDLEAVMSSLRLIENVDGVIATIPHKQAIIKLAKEIGPLGKATDAANVLVPIGADDWRAEIFDGYGMVEALKRRSIVLSGLRTLVIGAGGAGSAIAVALRKLSDVGRIRISDVDEERARALVERVDDSEVGLPDPTGFDLVINASPCGMGTEEMPIDPALLSSGTVVGDAVMKPLRTHLLKEAEQRGCVTVEGMEMLVGQIEPIAKFFGLEDNQS